MLNSIIKLMYQNNFIYYNNSYNFLNCVKYALKVKGAYDIVSNIDNPQKVFQTLLVGICVDRAIDCLQQRICNRYY